MKDEIVYKRLSKSDKPNIDNLIDICLKGLPRPEFFMPLSVEDKERFYDESYGIRLGAYDGGKIVATGGIYVAESKLEKIKSMLDLNDKKVCSLCNFLCLPEYRGRGIMSSIQSQLIEIAKDMNYETITATAHPENIASMTCLSKKLTKVKIADFNGYTRALMKLDLKTN